MGLTERLATAIVLEARPGGRVAIGSGVFVNSPDHAGTYLVTAKHVLGNAKGQTYVRLTRDSGAIEDLPILNWHGNSDEHEVAVARLAISRNDYRYESINLSRWWEGSGDFKPARRAAQADEGCQVYFIGAYPKIEAMAEQNRTMIRTGLLGLTWQDRVKVLNRTTQTELFHTVHLIDCYAHSGFSGSPCFVVRSEMHSIEDVARRQSLNRGSAKIRTDAYVRVSDFAAQSRTIRETWELIGILLGHFPHTEKIFEIGARIKQSEKKGEAESEKKEGTEEPERGVDINAGVGLVVPAYFISQTLMQDDVVREREQARVLRSDDAAVMDDGDVG